MKRWIYRQLWRTDLPAWFFIVAFMAILAANAFVYPYVNSMFEQRSKLQDIMVQDARQFSAKALEFDVSLLAMLNPMLKGPLGSDVVPEQERAAVLDNITGLVGALDGMKAWLDEDDVRLVEKYQNELLNLHDALLDVDDFMALSKIYPVLDEIAALHAEVTNRLRAEAGLPA